MTGYYLGRFPLILRPHPRARHLKLRFDARNRTALLTVPPGFPTRKALQFAEKHHDWIKDQDDKSPERLLLIPGQEIPYRGQPVTLTHLPDNRGSVKIDSARLIVGGPQAGFEVRVRNWLEKQARIALQDAVEKFTPRLGQGPKRIMIRDTTSRWGSCSSRKTLSFSWRLILTPGDVLQYVAAHEMAHLVEMNHGPEFWRLVGRLHPDWQSNRRWLKSQGNGLLLIG